jgi:FtsP/CotA-like multicopper oxidase with cupredoxin domain
MEEMPIMPIQRPVRRLNPAPTVFPNTAAGEGRTIPHQALNLFPPRKYYEVHQRLATVKIHPHLPTQRMWGFNGQVPGPTYVARYGEPILVRNFNELPPVGGNGGFGFPSVTTHLHNGHTPSESDGNPCFNFPRGKFYDQHYPNVYAGVLSTHPGTGDIREAMHTLWYHDHMLDFTAQNVYKGLAGFYLLFNEFDTGDETTGFHLPSFPEYDIQMLFADKVLDDTGHVAFDLFNLDGIIGDSFCVNGKVQPFLKVKPRRYRFRWLDAGPSRFYELFFTDLDHVDRRIPFWQISSDGNLLPRPVQVESFRMGVAERADIIIDFSQFRGKSIYIENRLLQLNGQGPTGVIIPAGAGNLLVRIDVDDDPVRDDSVDPATITQFYELPNKTDAPRIIRNFKFDRLNGQWSVNGQFMSCEDRRVKVKKNSVEHWVLSNLSGDWQHPIHIHFEEHQILSRQRHPVGPVEAGRKDVVRLTENERVELFFRFRDFSGIYPLHCHNLVHEDHAMMFLWEIGEDGDDNIVP